MATRPSQAPAPPRPDRRNGHSAPLRIAAAPRHRRLPWVLLGLALVVSCALAASISLSRLSGTTSVLVVARDVPAGRVLEGADLRVVELGNSNGVDSVRASDEPSLIGHPAAVSLLAGALLTRQEVGSPAIVAGPNEAVIAIAARPGQFPPGVAVGNQVRAIDSGVAEGTAAATAPTDALTAPVTGTVVAGDQSTGTAGAGAVVSLRVNATSPLTLAKAAALGRVTMILIPAAP